MWLAAVLIGTNDRVRNKQLAISASIVDYWSWRNRGFCSTARNLQR